MVTKQRSVAPFAAIGVFVGALVPLLFVTAIFADGTWEFNVDTLSALGVSASCTAANIFNYTCMCAGLLIAIFGIGKLICKDGLDSVSALFVAVGGLFLIGVGAFNMDTDYHNWFAWCFFTIIVIGMILSGFADWQNGRTVSAAITIITLGIMLAAVPGFALAGIEVIAVFSMCVWLIGQGMSLAFSKS